jgi:hypothetical protein
MSGMTQPTPKRGRVASLAGALALLSLLALAPAAQATSDPIAGGPTKLTFDKSFLSLLEQHGVKLSATMPATLKGKTATFPASGGTLDPTTGNGTIELEGGLKLQAANKHLPINHLTVKTKRTPLIAKVGGGQLKLASATKIAATRHGFDSQFSAQKLELTAKLAVRLNKRLKLKGAFTEGQLLGTLVSKTEPATVTVLPQGRATLAFDPGIMAKLDSLHVAVNPISPAEHPGPFTFPIIPNGQIAPDASAGTLRTGGEIEFLQLGGGQIFWHELWLDLGARVDTAEANIQPSPPYPGKLGRASLLDLGAATVSSEPKARTVTVTGAPLTLQATTAATFNEAFDQGKDTFHAGELLGTLSFTAQGQ